MMRNLREKTKDFMRTYSVESVEYVFALILFVWGLVLLSPTNVFDLAGFEAFAMVAHEAFWGVTACVIATSKFYSILNNSLTAKQMGTFISTFYFALIASMFAWIAPISTATALYSTIAIVSGWDYTRLALRKPLE